MNALTVFRLQNQVMSVLAAEHLAKKNSQRYLTPQTLKKKDWENKAEAQGERESYGNISTLVWKNDMASSNSTDTVLLMHGWGSRATQMHRLAKPLIKAGITVVAVDAPRHGWSKGDKVNPVVFAETLAHVAKQQKAKGRDVIGTVGHSMGGVAVALASSYGAELGRCVLVSTPHNIENELKKFADFVRMGKRATNIFIQDVSNATGVPASDIVVGNLLTTHRPRTLFIHSRDDVEVSYTNAERNVAAFPQAQLLAFNMLVHRKIIHNVDVMNSVSHFIINGEISVDRICA